MVAAETRSLSSGREVNATGSLCVIIAICVFCVIRGSECLT
jgi:hypothetical protein